MMDDWVEIRKDDTHVARERKKARELRESPWWREQLSRGICHYCGKKFPAEALTMDHVIPVARGGKSSRGNVVPCCGACNKEKKCLTPAERILMEMERQGELSDINSEGELDESSQL